VPRSVEPRRAAPRHATPRRAAPRLIESRRATPRRAAPRRRDTGALGTPPCAAAAAAAAAAVAAAAAAVQPWAKRRRDRVERAGARGQARAGPFPPRAFRRSEIETGSRRDADEISKIQRQLISAARNSMVMERARISLPVMRGLCLEFIIYRG